MSEGNGNIAAAPPKNRMVQYAPAASPTNLRMPPHSSEAEQGVLGSILVSPNESLAECREKIPALEYFFVPAHQVIYAALLMMDEQKRGIDAITLPQFIQDNGQVSPTWNDLQACQLFIISLGGYVPTAIMLGDYIGTVREMFVRREMIRICSGLVARAYDPDGNETKVLLDEAQGELTTLTLDRATESPLRHVCEVVPGVLEEIENAYSHRGRTQGLQTGFVDLDRMTSGLGAGEMIVIAARPSMGKTALAMNIAEHVSVDRSDGKWNYTGVPVAVFSLETSRHRLVRRLVAGRANVSIQKMRDGFFKDADFEQLEKAAEAINAAPIYIDDTPGLRLFEFKARMRWAVVKLGVKLGVIDYLQLMKSGSKRAEFSRVLELTEISAGIKEVGRELNIPIMVLAQLNRDAEKHESGRPRMMHLRECGAIEQDADLIGLLYRPEVYLQDGSAEQKEAEGEAELIIAKQKDGPVGKIGLTFLKEFTRFEDRAAADGSARPMYSNNPKKRQAKATQGEL